MIVTRGTRMLSVMTDVLLLPTMSNEDEDETTYVELLEEVAKDVFVDDATEQARKCFVLERRGEG